MYKKAKGALDVYFQSAIAFLYALSLAEQMKIVNKKMKILSLFRM